MTAFSFSSGDPTHLTSGANALMVDLSGPFADIKAYINGANLGVGNIAPNGVTAALIEAQQAWQTLALAAPFVGSNLIYMKDSLGFVHCRGDATVNASSSTTAAVCTLPAGFRPVSTQSFQVGNGCTITAAGVVTVTSVSGFAAFFSAVTFRAEN